MVNEDSVRSPLGGSMQTERMCIRVEINNIVASSRIMLCYMCWYIFMMILPILIAAAKHSKKAFGDSIPPTDQVLTRGMERKQAEAGLPRRFFCSNGALVSNSIKLTRKTDMNSFIIDKAPQPIAPRCPLICRQLKKTPRFVRTDCTRRGRESLRLVPRALTLSIL